MYINKKAKWLSLFLIAMVFVITSYFVVEYNIRPVIYNVAASRVNALATKCMNDAILENLKNVKYSDLITVVTGSDGKVSMLQANTSGMNSLSATTALVATQKLSNLGEHKIKLRIGNILGSQLLADYGPSIVLGIDPFGSVVSSFVSEFESAGINQTLHRVKMKMVATVYVDVGTTGQPVRVVVESPVAESIIIGDVPNSFMTTNGAQKLNLYP